VDDWFPDLDTRLRRLEALFPLEDSSNAVDAGDSAELRKSRSARLALATAEIQSAVGARRDVFESIPSIPTLHTPLHVYTLLYVAFANCVPERLKWRSLRPVL
jgi:hypothetical protein